MRIRSAFQLIPAAARALAAAAFVAIAALFFFFFDGHATIGLGTAIGAGIGAVVGGFILLAGYIYADASRRGMPPILWTALAVLIPNGIGFVLYFALRHPLVYSCSGCKYGVPADAAFCPACGHPQLDAEMRSSR
jgi:hypothetical protein